jgi:hypothetical protein
VVKKGVHRNEKTYYEIVCEMKILGECGRGGGGGGLEESFGGGTLKILDKPDGLFINRQDDAASIAVDLVPCAGRIDDQGSCFERSIFVPLRTGQDQNVFVSHVFMLRHLAVLAVSNQSGRWPGNPVPIQPKDVHPFFVRLPCDLILMFGQVKNVI